MILINPEGRDQSMAMFRKSVTMLLTCFENEEVLAELKRIDGMVCLWARFRRPEGDPWPLPDRGPDPEQSGNDRCDG